MFLIRKTKQETGSAGPPPKLKAPGRSQGLDALRGLAIIGMIFSWVFPHENSWPGYMFHAQVGPPDFVYTPQVPGITWVDLVFPFFLFAMGAAFPLALRKKVESRGVAALLPQILKRGLLLILFAILIRNLSWFELQGPAWVNQLTALVTFGCFFLLFMRFSSPRKEWLLKAVGLLVIAAMIWGHQSFTEYSFSKSRNDIIIVVLANMAVFGSLIWMLTRNNIPLRMGILAFFAAIWFTHDIEGSWTGAIWDFHPSLRWMYHFSYLKYLCIVLPGTVLGDLMLRHAPSGSGATRYGRREYLLAGMGLLIILVNLYGLYTRELIWNLFLTTALLLAGGWISRKKADQNLLFRKVWGWAAFFILLGLFFEPLDGGIKKDPSSFSYWFLTSGLAFLAFLICEVISQRALEHPVWRSMIRTGQNPMVAYVASGFLITPLLGLFALDGIFDWLGDTHRYLGLVRTFVITFLVVWVTQLVTKKKWYWKT